MLSFCMLTYYQQYQMQILGLELTNLAKTSEVQASDIGQRPNSWLKPPMFDDLRRFSERNVIEVGF